MEDRIERIKQQLQAQNYKLTPQREATLRVLLENEADHLSAEDVYLMVKQKAPEIGLATVYRTLELLSDLKIIHKLNFGDGVARYDFLTEGQKHLHHHIECLQCGRVEEIMEDLLEPIEQKVEQDFGFKIMDHRLTFLGICRNCLDEGVGKKLHTDL